MTNLATFHPNPNELSEPWIERSILQNSGLRVWHLMFFCFGGFLTILILICCCVKIRIPRTKQEIEANYCRKKLVEKFRARIKLIQNQDIDAMDLQKALEIIQEDYKSEIKAIDDYKFSCDVTNNLKAEPQQPNRFNKILKIMKIGKRQADNNKSTSEIELKF